MNLIRLSVLLHEDGQVPGLDHAPLIDLSRTELQPIVSIVGRAT